MSLRKASIFLGSFCSSSCEERRGGGKEEREREVRDEE
jgi:hypothetical protein